MSQWQIAGMGNFDDGQSALPGEVGFNTDAVKAVAKGRPFNWMGQSPGYVAPTPIAPDPEPAE